MFRQPDTDDTVLNMTPMIDIVFQLILFFLFSLRFKGLDHRIDMDLPQGLGLRPIPIVAPEIPSVRVSLVRERPEDPASPTKVRVGGFDFVVPAPSWSGDRAKDADTQARRDAVFRSIQAQIVALNPHGDLKGRIEVRPPKGDSVPHADVVSVIDAFLGAGVPDVLFEGARSPLPHSPPR